MKKRYIKTRHISSMIGLGIILLSNHALAENLTVGSKATASVVASCQIKAQSINFGALALPLGPQSATGNLDVLCSKEAPYKIDMAFGLSTNYWATTSAGGRWVEDNWYANTALYDGTTGKQITTSGYSYPQGANYQAMLATAMKCTVTADGKCHATAGSANNGVMIGAKDSVAYTIFVPGDNSKVWNIGKNSYSGTGTGLNQTIPVHAQIVPSASTPFPAPDMYSDTLVATITY